MTPSKTSVTATTVRAAAEGTAPHPDLGTYGSTLTFRVLAVKASTVVAMAAATSRTNCTASGGNWLGRTESTSRSPKGGSTPRGAAMKDRTRSEVRVPIVPAFLQFDPCASQATGASH